MGKHSITPPPAEYRRRSYEVAAARWLPGLADPNGEQIIAWLESNGIEAKYAPVSGPDFHATSHVIISRDALGSKYSVLAVRGSWFVLYPDGSVKTMSDLDFQDEFEPIPDHLKETT